MAGPESGAKLSPNPLAGWAASVVAHPSYAPEWLVSLSDKTLTKSFGAKRTTTVFTRGEMDQATTLFAPLNQRLAERVSDTGQALKLELPESSREDLCFRDDLTDDFWMQFAKAIFYQTKGG